MSKPTRWSREVSGVMLALALICFSAPAAFAEAVNPISLLQDGPPPDDAQLALDIDETTSAEPIHPWDNNDYSDSLEAPGSLRHKPKGTPVVIPRSTDKVELNKLASGTKPENIGFLRNLPNPFNAQTRIEFALLQAGPAVLEVYNLLGQVQARVEWQHLSAGTHSWLWRGQTSDGRSVPSGVYFYRLEASQASAIGRMVLLK